MAFQAKKFADLRHVKHSDSEVETSPTNGRDPSTSFRYRYTSLRMTQTISQLVHCEFLIVHCEFHDTLRLLTFHIIRLMISMK